MREAAQRCRWNSESRVSASVADKALSRMMGWRA